MNGLELWRALNNPISPLAFQQAKEEYLHTFNTTPFNPSVLDYGRELCYELGLYSGNELYVPLECQSPYHDDKKSTNVPVLPYFFKDGTRRLVCKHCDQAEFNEYNAKYPTDV